MPHDVFLSYSHQDIQLMGQVSNDLQAAGMVVWSDTRLHPGTESWRKAIEDAIDETCCVVVIFSPEAKESKWVTAELDYANSQKKPIFPILARGDEHDAVPFGFVTAQRIDIRDSNRYAMEIGKLIDAVRGQVANPTAHSASHTSPLTPHHVPLLEKDKLDPWNFLHQARLLSWLFLSPMEYLQQRNADREALLKTGGWIVSTLCWLPLLLPILGYTMGTVQVSNPSTSNRFLLAAYAVYFGGWFSSALLAGRSDRSANLIGFFLTAFMSVLSFVVVGGVGQIILIEGSTTASLIMLLTTCISLGFAAAIALVVTNGGTGVVAGVVVGTFIAITLFKIPIGVAGGISGVLMGVIAFVLSASLDQGLKKGQPTWLSRGMLALGIMDYAVMCWIYLLGGWFFIHQL